MRLESLRQFCLSLPGADEIEQWECHILFRIGGKMFCISTFEPTNYSKIGFKCSPDDFAGLIEREGIVPSPYMARNHWVTLLDWDALPATELKTYIRRSYDLVLSKLPKKTQAQIAAAASGSSASKSAAASNTVRRKQVTKRNPAAAAAKKPVKKSTAKPRSRG